MLYSTSSLDDTMDIYGSYNNFLFYGKTSKFIQNIQWNWSLCFGIALTKWKVNIHLQEEFIKLQFL